MFSWLWIHFLLDVLIILIRIVHFLALIPEWTAPHLQILLSICNLLLLKRTLTDGNVRWSGFVLDVLQFSKSFQMSCILSLTHVVWLVTFWSERTLLWIVLPSWLLMTGCQIARASVDFVLNSNASFLFSVCIFIAIRLFRLIRWVRWHVINFLTKILIIFHLLRLFRLYRDSRLKCRLNLRVCTLLSTFFSKRLACWISILTRIKLR